MKYVSPSFLNESVEISDVIQLSVVSVAYVDRATGEKDEHGNDIVVRATEVTVDVSGLF